MLINFAYCNLISSLLELGSEDVLLYIFLGTMKTDVEKGKKKNVTSRLYVVQESID